MSVCRIAAVASSLPDGPSMSGVLTVLTQLPQELLLLHAARNQLLKGGFCKCLNANPELLKSMLPLLQHNLSTKNSTLVSSAAKALGSLLQECSIICDIYDISLIHNQVCALRSTPDSCFTVASDMLVIEGFSYFLARMEDGACRSTLEHVSAPIVAELTAMTTGGTLGVCVTVCVTV